MKVSELTGAQLDYWVARAEGIAAEKMHYDAENERYVILRSVSGGASYFQHRPYSSRWDWGGQLLEKHKLCLGEDQGRWECCTADTDYESSLWNMRRTSDGIEAEGDSPLQAICRTVVMSKFGTDVDDGIRESAAHLSAQS